MGFGFWVLGFGFWVLGFEVWGLRFGDRVWGQGLRVEGVGVWGCAAREAEFVEVVRADQLLLRAWGSGLWVYEFGFRLQGSENMQLSWRVQEVFIEGLGRIRVSGVGFRVSNFGF